MVTKNHGVVPLRDSYFYNHGILSVQASDKKENALQLAREKFNEGKTKFHSWWSQWFGRCGLDELRDALAIQLVILGKKHEETALSHFWIGRSLRCHFEHQKSLVEFANALSTQEAVLGRYHSDTSATYYWFGDTFYRLGHADMAAVAFRSASRIKRTMLRKMNVPPTDIDPDQRLRKVFQQNGLTVEAIESLSLGISKSVMHEQKGDELREMGKFSEALAEYVIAVQVEESDAGQPLNMVDHILPNPEVAFLWRKIACLWSLKAPRGNKSAFWEATDRIESSDWTAIPKKCRYGSACQAIQSGDLYFADLNPERAILEYKRAVSIDKQRDDILFLAAILGSLFVCSVILRIMHRVINFGAGSKDSGIIPNQQAKTELTRPSMMETSTKVEIILVACGKSLGNQLARIKNLVEEGDKDRAMAEYHKAAQYEKLFVDQLVDSFVTTFPGLDTERELLEACRRTMNKHLSHVKSLVEAENKADAKIAHLKALEVEKNFLRELRCVADKIEGLDSGEMVEEPDGGVQVLEEASTDRSD